MSCILCGLLCAQNYLVADCCCVVSLAGEAKAFFFKQYFTQRLLADPRYKSKALNSNVAGGGGWARGVRKALKPAVSFVGGIVSVLGGEVE
jgi:hypothetical protein